MNPPFKSDGTTATHSAEDRTSSGIPVSGADSISSRTVPAAVTRSSALLVSLFSNAKAMADMAKTSRTTRLFFINVGFSEEFWDVPECSRRGWVCARRHASTAESESLAGSEQDLARQKNRG